MFSWKVMFTGLIESVGEIAEVKAIDAGFTLRIASDIAGDLRLGESVAVNGVCLTVVDIAKAPGVFSTEIGPETARVTSLGHLQAGAAVNLERAMPANGRFGGHMVLGHVDGTGTIQSIRPEAEFSWFTVGYPDRLAPYLIHRGSIAVDGISLTIAALRKDDVRRPDCPVYLVAHESRQQAGRRSREPRVRYGRQVRAPRHGVHGDESMTAPLKIARRRRKSSPFASIEDAIEAFRAGEMIIVCDDEDRENEGDLTLAAEKVTPKAINFMAKYGRGLICMPMTGQRLDELEIPLMVNQNTARLGTAFCVTIEAKHSTSTGISAGDRANTVLAAIDSRTRPSDLARPGHMFPLRAQSGGVLVRAGQTEAAVDLARIGGLYPAGVICEIMNDDGSMARVPELTKFAKRHKLLMITIADLIKYRMHNESMVREVAKAKLPTEYGEFDVHAFENQLDKQTHIALVFGEVGDGSDIVVRVHSQCLTGTCCTRSGAIAAASSTPPCAASPTKGEACCCISTRRGAASGWRTRFAPTSCRIRAWIRSKRTRSWASRPTSATTASACRFFASWAYAPCVC